MAITGHQSLEEVEVDTREAANAKLADAGIRKVTGHKPVSHFSGLADTDGTKGAEVVCRTNDL